MKFFKIPKIFKQDIYIERVLDGYNYTEFTEKERIKLKELRLTLYYKKKRLEWIGFLIFLFLFILASAKVVHEEINFGNGYNFGNGVIFGFLLFGLTLTFLTLLRNIDNFLEKFDNDVLFDEKKIFEKYELVEIEPEENKENDNNGEDTIH